MRRAFTYSKQVLSMGTKLRHQALISLGSNIDARQHILQALEVLRSSLEVTAESQLLETAPVDFPYHSGPFTNVLLACQTELEESELLDLLHQLEARAGRDRQTPQSVPLDADLITWDEVIRKPEDIQRPYFSQLRLDASTPRP